MSDTTDFLKYWGGVFIAGTVAIIGYRHFTDEGTSTPTETRRPANTDVVVAAKMMTMRKLLNPSILWNTSTLNRWLGPPMFTVQKVFSATPHPQHTAEVSLLIQ